MNHLSIPIFVIAATFATNAFDSSLPSPRAAGPVEAYVPELGQQMDSIQMHHAKLWYAGSARNWPLTAYEAREMREVFEIVGKYRSQIKEKQIAMMIDTIMVAPIAQVESAAAAGSRRVLAKYTRPARP